MSENEAEHLSRGDLIMIIRRMAAYAKTSRKKEWACEKIQDLFERSKIGPGNILRTQPVRPTENNHTCKGEVE